MIAYFVYNFGGYSGAAQQALLLAKACKQPILFFNVNRPAFKIDRTSHDFMVIDLPTNPFFQILLLAFFTFKYRIKLYHMHGYFRNALITARILRRKTIMKTTLLGDDDLDTLAHSALGWFKIGIVRWVDINIVLSKALEVIHQQYLPSYKIKRIANGVQVPDSLDILTEKKHHFCFVGLVCQRKGTLESIRYFARYYAKLPDARLYIVGPYQNMLNNREFDAAYVQDCQQFIRQNALQEQVIFTGLLSKEETCKIYAQCKALLFFSEKEGMPNVLLEAMAHNCVPIVKPLEGVSAEIVTHGVDGFILESLNEEIPVDGIEYMLELKAPYHRMQHAFSMEALAVKINALYQHLSAKKHGKTHEA